MPFAPRQGNYLRIRNGRPYYRRRIPSAYRPFYAGRCEWLIRLSGPTPYDIEMEAKSLAFRHNAELRELDALSARERGEILQHLRETGEPPEDSRTALYSNATSKLFVDGKVRDDLNWVVQDSLRRVRNAQGEGFFAMTVEEARHRLALAQLAERPAGPLSEVEQELMELRRYKSEQELRKLEREKSSLKISDAIKKWHERDSQRVITPESEGMRK